MKVKALLLSALLVSPVALSTGCARPGEFGYSPAYSTREGLEQDARNWDYEGKQAVDDLDHILLLKPASTLTIWTVR